MNGHFEKGAWVEDRPGAVYYGGAMPDPDRNKECHTSFSGRGGGGRMCFQDDSWVFQPTPQWAESLIEEMWCEIRHYRAVERFKQKVGLL